VAERQETAQAVTHDLADDRLTRAVLASFEQSTSDRFRTVPQSLVRHLHAFVREVELTEQEWARGIDFLTRTGQITTDQRQEFNLLSDVLGISMLTIGVNHRRPAGVQGTPFWTAAYDLVLAPSTSDAQR
jgi:hydroxyquinol 1,2-dioxygenase